MTTKVGRSRGFTSRDELLFGGVQPSARQLLNPRGPGFVVSAFGHHTLFACVSCAYINCAVAFYFATIAIVYTGL